LSGLFHNGRIHSVFRIYSLWIQEYSLF